MAVAIICAVLAPLLGRPLAHGPYAPARPAQIIAVEAPRRTSNHALCQKVLSRLVLPPPAQSVAAITQPPEAIGEMFSLLQILF